MSETARRFKVNEPDVIEEVIDGEAIIADLGRGLYYSLDDGGSRVWAALTGEAESTGWRRQFDAPMTTESTTVP